MDRDRNLLFGVFAVQLGKVEPHRLAQAALEWAAHPERGLSDYFREHEILSDHDCAFILRIVDAAIDAYEGNPAATLQALGGESQIRQTFRNSIQFTAGGTIVPGEGGAPDDPGSLRTLGVAETPGRYSRPFVYGRGGMGQVLLVHDEHLKRDVALKELLPESEIDQTATTAVSPVRASMPMVARFLQEARITGQLEHPSIVPVYELGHREDGTIYYTMKLVRGKTLSQALLSRPSLSGRLGLLSHFVNLAQAIAYAHSRGVIHRDIKPSNVMIGDFGETVVLDWGLAKAEQQSDVHAIPLSSTLEQARSDRSLRPDTTQYGAVLGTPHYMAPEQAEGAIQRVDKRSDVYSLGAVLFELLTGQPPHDGATTQDILEHVLNEEPPDVASLESHVPPELAAICHRAMQRDPDQRYQTARELAEDMERYLNGALVQAYEYRFSEHLRRYVHRHKAVLATVAASVVLLLGLGAYYNVHLYKAREAEHRQRLAVEEAHRTLEREYYASALMEVRKNIDEGNSQRAEEVLYRTPAPYRDWEWGRLFCEAHRELYWLQDDIEAGQFGMPICISFSPDGRYVLSVRDFGGIHSIYDTATNEVRYIGPVNEYGGWPFCSGFTSDPELITAGKDMHTVVLLHYPTDSVRATYHVDNGWLLSLMVTPDGKTAVGYRVNPDTHERFLEFFDATTGSISSTCRIESLNKNVYSGDREFIQHHMPRGRVLGFLDGGNRVLYTDTAVRILDLRTGDTTEVVDCSEGLADFGANSGRVAVLRPSRDLEVWNVDPPAYVATMEEVPVGHQDFRISSDGLFVARISNFDWAAYDANSGRLLQLTRGDSVGIESLSLHPSRPCLVTFGQESTIKFWNIQEDPWRRGYSIEESDGTSLDSWLTLHPWLITPVDVNSEMERMAITSHGEVAIVSPQTGRVERRWKAHNDDIKEVAFSPDGRLLATASLDGRAILWRLSDGEPLWVFAPPEPEPVLAVAFTSDGCRVAIGSGADSSENRGINPSFILGTDDGEVRVITNEFPKRTSMVGFSPDGKILACGSWGRATTEEKSVAFYDAETGEPLPGGIAGLGWPSKAVTIPHTNRTLFLGSLGSMEVAIWDFDTNQLVFRVPKVPAFAVAINPEGTRYAVADHLRHQVTVHDLHDGRLLAEFPGCTGPLSFTPDGMSLIAGMGPSGLEIMRADRWDAPTRVSLQQTRYKSLRKYLYGK